MKRSASESKPLQIVPESKFPAKPGGKRLSRSKLKESSLIDSDAELFMYLIQGIKFGSS